MSACLSVMSPRLFLLGLLVFLVNDHQSSSAYGQQLDRKQGEMAGEVDTGSVILQSRLTAPELDKTGDVPGRAGVGRFEISTDKSFAKSRYTDWLTAKPESDFILKTKVTGLQPGTRYYYRLQFGETENKTETGPVNTFETLPAPETVAEMSFVVVTGMNYRAFYKGLAGRPAYKGKDRDLGFPALASILKLKPDFFVGTGDNVYYDHPYDNPARTPAELRKKWHEQFVQPRYVDLFANVPTYWEKDDHDFRYNDCDLSKKKREPGVELGLETFREQVPVVDPDESDPITYRTYRMGKLLQVWFTENRDYRSNNRDKDGPEKTIWGKKQRAWLQETLQNSDATFKVLISPTPMIGPDGKGKIDNHTNINGFRHERDSFFQWIKEQKLDQNGFYIVCGDRHWQYHSIHPTGVEEFSTGALVDANSRLGVAPGNKKGTDPEGLVKQPYTSNPASGGFLYVKVTPEKEDSKALLQFLFYDEQGKLLHQVDKTQPLKH